MIFPRAFAAGLLALALVAGCGQPAASFSVSIVPASPTAKAFISVAGLSSAELSALSRASFSRDQWLALIRVTVDGADAANPPVLGQHRVTSTTVDFIPMFPFDPGRGYAVEIDPTKLPTFAEAPAGKPTPRTAQSFRTVVVIPAELRSPTVTVSRMLPTAAVLPENLLRIYLEFSGPMAREHGRDFLKLVEVNKDGTDVDVKDAFLALDVDFWSPDGRRYTVLLDPGRVKRGILPNDQFGRALKPGRRFALIVDPKWRDEHGQRLAAAFRHEFLVGPAEMTPLRLADWKVHGPSFAKASDGKPSSTVQGPLLVHFPRSLDHGLLQRALGVQRDGQPIEGDIAIGANETEWRFTPKSAWTPGRYELVVLSILEDPMGNQIGRTFDVDKFTEIDKSASPDRMTIPFTVR